MCVCVKELGMAQMFLGSGKPKICRINQQAKKLSRSLQFWEKSFALQESLDLLLIQLDDFKKPI